MAIKSRPGRASLVIRNLDPAVKQRLRVRAAQRGRSMEAEARAILEQSVNGAATPAGENLYDRIRARLGRHGGVDLKLPPRGAARSLPRFD